MSTLPIRHAKTMDVFLKRLYEIHELFVETAAKPLAGNSVAAICESSDAIIADARDTALRGLQCMSELYPVVTMMSRHGAIAQLVLDGMPPTRKDQLMIALPISMTLRTSPIDAYSLFAEIWVAFPGEDETAEEAQRLPSERTDRHDGVIVIAGTRLGTAVEVFIIERDATGKVTGLGPRPRPDDRAVEIADEHHTAYNPLLTNLFTLVDRLTAGRGAVEKILSGEPGGRHSPRAN